MSIVKVVGSGCGSGSSNTIYVDDKYYGTIQFPCGASNDDMITLLKNWSQIDPLTNTIYYNGVCINLCTPPPSNSSYLLIAVGIIVGAVILSRRTKK